MSKTPFYSHFYKITQKTQKTRTKKKQHYALNLLHQLLPAFRCTDYKLDMFGVCTTKKQVTKEKSGPRQGFKIWTFLLEF